MTCYLLSFQGPLSSPGQLHGSELPCADCKTVHVTLLTLPPLGVGAVLSWDRTASSVRQSGFMRTKNNVQCTACLGAPDQILGAWRVTSISGSDWILLFWNAAWLELDLCSPDFGFETRLTRVPVTWRVQLGSTHGAVFSVNVVVWTWTEPWLCLAERKRRTV